MNEIGPARVDTDGGAVLLAIGDTDMHDATLRFAVDLALRQRRTLLLVHVVNLVEGMVAPEQLLLGSEVMEVRAQELLESWVERARSLTQGRVCVDSSLRFGPVVSELLEVSRTADRIVLQRRQHARLSHVLMGSVCAGVASRAQVPVVCVPEPWSGTGRTTRLAAAVDGTDRGDAVLEWAFREAALLGAGLRLVHAWFMPSLYQEAFLGRGAVNLSREATRQHVEGQLTRWRSTFPSVDARLHIVHAQPVDALVEASRHADLLLLGRRRTHGMVHLGLLARSVLHRAQCPVGVIASGTTDPAWPDTPRHRRAHRATKPTTATSHGL